MLLIKLHPIPYIVKDVRDFFFLYTTDSITDKLLSAPSCRGSLTGSLSVTGTITATGNVTAYSDIKLKEDIEVIPDAITKINALHGYT